MVVAFIRQVPRLLLALVFLVAGLLKGVDPLEFAHEIEGYGILSGNLALALAYALVPVELALGLALLVGFRIRWASAGTCLLLLLFMSVTAYAWSQGKTEGCGCFGSMVSRTPGEVLVEDLVFLVLGGLAFALAGIEERGRRWPGVVMTMGVLMAVVLPFAAYALPLDPIVTDLKVGRRVEDLPLRDSPVDLGQGDHLVALLDLEAEDAGETVSRLNEFQAQEGAPPVTAFYGGEVDEKVVFCFNYDPGFEVVAVPRTELKRLHRRLPRFFLLHDGEVKRIWDGVAPRAADWVNDETTEE